MKLATLFFAVSTLYHLPPDLLSKICFVESSFRENVVTIDHNGLHSVGLCQIQLRTAQALGFKGEEKDLLDPHTNVKYAGAYLSYQFDRYGSWVKAVKAYNAGFAKTDKPNHYYRKVCSVDLENQIPILLGSIEQ
jgi:soluble lytic murein transglycosylase-like protein